MQGQTSEVLGSSRCRRIRGSGIKAGAAPPVRGGGGGCARWAEGLGLIAAYSIESVTYMYSMCSMYSICSIPYSLQYSLLASLYIWYYSYQQYSKLSCCLSLFQPELVPPISQRSIWGPAGSTTIIIQQQQQQQQQYYYYYYYYYYYLVLLSFSSTSCQLLIL